MKGVGWTVYLQKKMMFWKKLEEMCLRNAYSHMVDSISSHNSESNFANTNFLKPMRLKEYSVLCIFRQNVAVFWNENIALNKHLVHETKRKKTKPVVNLM